MITSRRLRGNGPHLGFSGKPSGFSRVAAGALDLRRGPQGPALVASGKAIPHTSCSGASRDSSPVECRGVRPCVEFVSQPEGSSPVLTWILRYFWSLPRGVSPRRLGACTCAFLPSCSSSVTLHFAWFKGSVSFPRGFPTRLSHRAVPRATVG